MDRKYTANHMMKHTPQKYFSLKTGKTLAQDVVIETKLHELRSDMRKVQKVEDCDFILVFCPVVSRIGTDIEAAIEMLSNLPGNKPAVFLVLHHTYDPELVVPDSSKTVKRNHTIIVDFLFYEDLGLLPCPKNEEALFRVANWIIPKEISVGSPRPGPEHKTVNRPRKYFTISTGNTPRQEETIEKIIEETAGLQKEPTAATCDFFLVFCTGSEVKDAQHLIQSDTTKPAVLVVLHQPLYFITDTSKTVRESTITVDCLFCEDQGLIQCFPNNAALLTFKNWLSERVWHEMQSPNGPMMQHPYKYFTCSTENTPTHYQAIQTLHTIFPDLQEVPTAENCDFILFFCAANYIEAAHDLLSHQPANKAAVVIVLHTTCTIEHDTGSGSCQTVIRDNTIKVDCFFTEGQELLPCFKNQNALSEIVSWLIKEEETSPQKEEKKSNKTKGQPSSMCKTAQQVKYFTLLTGMTLNAHVDFLRFLYTRVSGLQEVHSIAQCDVILLFTPVVSRAGTDIQAALRKLSDLHVNKPAVLVVLHHTFDPEGVVSDSSKLVNSGNMIAVDCLFYEDQGLLQCTKNNDAYTQVSCWIKAQKKPQKKTR